MSRRVVDEYTENWQQETKSKEKRNSQGRDPKTREINSKGMGFGHSIV